MTRKDGLHMNFIELEIRLHSREEAGQYNVEMLFSRSDDEAETAPLWGQAHIDFDALKAEFDPEVYGRILTKSLFEDQGVRDSFARAYDVAQALESPLRIRLHITPDAEELHNLRWETLRKPQPWERIEDDDGVQTNPLLLTDEHLLFSRYLSSKDYHPVRLRPETHKRALVVIANPTDIASYNLASLDVDKEVERARASLSALAEESGNRVEVLAANGKANLNTIMDHLRDGYDILYMVCHGMLMDGEPWLWLENPMGQVARTQGTELVDRLSELQNRPRLIVLASCQSAGPSEDAESGDQGALAGLGPRLAEMGIPAVIAMQGNITLKTVEMFMPRFFTELLKDGLIDRAMAVARQAVYHRPDNWVPVLFMRLKTGTIRWYTPGFTDDRAGIENWPDLLNNIRDGCCTPILGSGLTEFLFGSKREIALRWADKWGFPMASYLRQDLPQVAQFLAIKQSVRFPRAELKSHLRDELLSRHLSNLSAEVQDKPLDELMETVWLDQQERQLTEPHKIFARLPLPLYIVTNPDNLLASALKKAGKRPETDHFVWNRDRESPDSVFTRESSYRPSKERPLVYHFFGEINEPDSLVVTEDNYFEYLIGLGRNNKLVPDRVLRAVTDASLLFLGFQLDEWDFRVLFRSIMRLAGGGRLEDYSHVAVQIDPVESRPQDLDKARDYFKEYFNKARINIFWGSIEEFTKQLRDEWLKKFKEDLGQ